MARNCKRYNTDIQYRATAMVQASDDKWYVSTCNHNLHNNPIHNKTYMLDGEEYLYWASADDILDSI